MPLVSHELEGWELRSKHGPYSIKKYVYPQVVDSYGNVALVHSATGAVFQHSAEQSQQLMHDIEMPIKERS